jgi:hypothetical protein
MLMAMQQAEQEAAEQEAELERQRAEKEAMERQRVKNLRAQADADVLSALEDKYNDDTDYVEFYPDMLTFSQYNNELDQQNEKAKKKQGATPVGPDTSTTVASGGTGAASIGTQTSSDIETGNKGEAPKVPDAKKSKEDLKKKKITGTETDDTESLSQPPVSDGGPVEDDEDEKEVEDDEIEDEDDEDGAEKVEDAEVGDEHQAEMSPQKEKPNNQPMGTGERKIFKIKPVDHVSGSKFVGQGEFEAEQGDEEDEEGPSSDSPFGGKGKSSGKPPFGKGKDTPDPDEDDDEKPKVKKFSEFNKK